MLTKPLSLTLQYYPASLYLFHIMSGPVRFMYVRI